MVHSTSDIISCFEAEQKNTVFSALSEYLSSGLYVDISLICRGQILRAHKVVLSSSSKYFRDFFRHQPTVTIIDLDKELAPNDLHLTLEDVQLIIGILYCVGTVEINPQRIETLLVCAQVLGIPTLISFLKKIRETITTEGKSSTASGRVEYRPMLPAGPTGPAAKILLPPRRSFNSSSLLPQPNMMHKNNDVLYLLPTSTSPIFPPSASNHPAQSSRFSSSTSRVLLNSIPSSNSPSSSSFSQQFLHPDLSIVKPLTSSSLNTPVPPPETSKPSSPAASSPVPGGSSSGGIQDSLLPCHPRKLEAADD